MTKTYSFAEAILVLIFPDEFRLSTNGLGLGSISVSYASSRTGIAVSADGTPVVSKINDKHGSLSLTVQQTSELHQQLVKRFNLMDDKDKISEWASIVATLTNRSTGEEIVMTGVAFDGIPEASYEANSGTYDWVFTVSEINTSII